MAKRKNLKRKTARRQRLQQSQTRRAHGRSGVEADAVRARRGFAEAAESERLQLGISDGDWLEVSDAIGRWGRSLGASGSGPGASLPQGWVRSAVLTEHARLLSLYRAVPTICGDTSLTDVYHDYDLFEDDPGEDDPRVGGLREGDLHGDGSRRIVGSLLVDSEVDDNLLPDAVFDNDVVKNLCQLPADEFEESWQQVLVPAFEVFAQVMSFFEDAWTFGYGVAWVGDLYELAHARLAGAGLLAFDAAMEDIFRDNPFTVTEQNALDGVLAGPQSVRAAVLGTSARFDREFRLIEAGPASAGVIRDILRACYLLARISVPARSQHPAPSC